MMLSTGNSRRSLRQCFSSRRGITFIEVMVTVVVLSVGLVGLYRGFFSALNYLDHLSVRLHAVSLMDGRIARIERDFRSLEDFDIGALSEEVLINGRQVLFQYAMDLKPVGTLLSVFELDIVLSWQERGHAASISRAAYFSGVSSLTALAGGA